MKSYTITVNGVAYDVTVEETAGNGAPVAAPKAAWHWLKNTARINMYGTTA